jgi:hypothetical protein
MGLPWFGLDRPKTKHNTNLILIGPPHDLATLFPNIEWITQTLDLIIT